MWVMISLGERAGACPAIASSRRRMRASASTNCMDTAEGFFVRVFGVFRGPP